MNIFLKRLVENIPQASRPVRLLVQKLRLESRGVPLQDQHAPRLTKEGTLDLTASTLFVRDTVLHAEIVNACKGVHFPVSGPFGPVNFASAITILLRNIPFLILKKGMKPSLCTLHTLWRQKEPFTPLDCANYRTAAKNFGLIWAGLGWKVSTWVHWTVCHSPALAELHKNFFCFSSIPTERRNVEFKLDIRHCFKGYKVSNPSAPACRLGFAHVLSLSALDAGLCLHDAQRRGNKRKA